MNSLSHVPDTQLLINPHVVVASAGTHAALVPCKNKRISRQDPQ